MGSDNSKNMGLEEQPRYPRYDPDIDLAEVAARIWKRKWVVLACLVVCTAIGAFYAITKDNVYEYTTTIEIGTRAEEEQTVAIEQPKTVLAKLEKSYIPEAIRAFDRELREKNGFSSVGINLEANTPNDTDLVILTSRGTAARSEQYIDLHNRIIKRLANDHERQAALQRIELNNQLSAAREKLEQARDERVLRVARDDILKQISSSRNELAQLKNESEVLEAELANLDVQENLVKRRLDELATFIEEARNRRADAQQQAQSSVDSMALMLLDNELQRYIDRRTELEERLFVELPESRAEFLSDIEENQRAQALQEEKTAALDARYEKLLLDQEAERAQAQRNVEELEAQVEALRPTRAVLPPQQSLRPIGPGERIILLVAIVFGLFLGLAVAIFMMFVKSVVYQLKRRDS